MTALPPPASALAAWVGQAIPDDDPRASAVLSAATALVRGYAGRTEEWANDGPDDVSALVVQVASRVYLSPANTNLKGQAIGPFNESYFDGASNGLYLTDEEKTWLNRYRGSASGLGVLITTRGEGGYCDPRQFVNTDPLGDPILYLSNEDVGL